MRGGREEERRREEGGRTEGVMKDVNSSRLTHLQSYSNLLGMCHGTGIRATFSPSSSSSFRISNLHGNSKWNRCVVLLN